MLRALLLIAVFLYCTLSQPEAFAALSAEKTEQARNAFLFADRKDWDNALTYAERVKNPAFLKLISWKYFLDNDSGAEFNDIIHFIDTNPTWPDIKKLRIHAEMTLHKNNVPDHDLIAWFDSTGNEPITGVGKIALAEALVRSKMAKAEKTTGLIRDAWHNGDFDEPEEKRLLATYGSLLRSEDHISRIDRLLWEEKISIAKHILSRVPAGYQKLFKARMALIDNKRLSVLAIALVPSPLKSDPGLIYDRMRYRARHDDNNGVRDMLLAAPAHPPHPEKWWKLRETQIHDAINEKKLSLAKKLLANHGQIDGAGLSDALWLTGWLKTEFMNQPKEGYNDFTAMYEQVHYPVSKARAAYWAGRAAENTGDTANAGKWYDTAATFPTTFYGQLASLKQHGTAPLQIQKPPAISSEAKHKLEQNDLLQALKLCVELNEMDSANHLMAWLVENTENAGEVAAIAALGNATGHKHMGVRAAKKAMQQNIVLLSAGYPTLPTPASQPVPHALTLAIARQESEFDPMARSPSGALGMMQLLPGTAKEIAKKHGIKFSHDRLFEADYNMELGSLYLSRLTASYDGSYIMAIAAYNAGPGNVHNWVRQFGTPGNHIDNAVDWIEKIPYHETRNYVQRVLENLQLYRQIEASGGASKLMLGEDLLR